VVAFLPPGSSDEGLARLGLLVEARATELLEQSGRFSELHVKQVLAMADAEGLLATELDDPQVGARAREALGADTVVLVSLERAGSGLGLTGSVLSGGEPVPFSVKLPARPAQALARGSEALAQAVLATVKATLPPRPVAQPESRSDVAVTALAECYAVVIRQPLGLESPAVLVGEVLDRASARCDQAVEADPGLRYAQAVSALARALLGEDEAAVKALQGLGAGDDVVEPSTMARFWLVTRFQSPAEGLSALREVLRKHPGELLALNYLGDSLGALGRHPEAAAAWREYLERVPASPFALGRLSRELARSGQHEEAVAAARKGLQLAPRSRQARLELGSRQLDAGQLDLAVATLRELADDPDARGETLLRLGWAYWLQGRPELSGPLYQRALELATGPTEWRTRGRALSNLAMVQLKLGDREAARATVRRALDGGFRPSRVDASLEALEREALGDAGVGPAPREATLDRKATPPRGYEPYGR
jgi:tetratricopeptide (TPR) repeat protein